MMSKINLNLTESLLSRLTHPGRKIHHTVVCDSTHPASCQQQWPAAPNQPHQKCHLWWAMVTGKRRSRSGLRKISFPSPSDEPLPKQSVSPKAFLPFRPRPRSARVGGARAAHSFEQCLSAVTFMYGLKCGFFAGNVIKLTEDIQVL